MVESRPTYVRLVTGLTGSTRARARGVARAVLAQAGLEEVATEVSERITRLAEEILAASRANRELVESLVSTEVERAAGRLGFARQQDLDALREELAALRLLVAAATPAGPPPRTTSPRTTPPRKTPPRKTPATNAPVPHLSARNVPVKKAPVKKVPAKKAPAAGPGPVLEPPEGPAVGPAVGPVE